MAGKHLSTAFSNKGIFYASMLRGSITHYMHCPVYNGYKYRFRLSLFKNLKPEQRGVEFFTVSY